MFMSVLHVHEFFLLIFCVGSKKIWREKVFGVCTIKAAAAMIDLTSDFFL